MEKLFSMLGGQVVAIDAAAKVILESIQTHFDKQDGVASREQTLSNRLLEALHREVEWARADILEAARAASIPLAVPNQEGVQGEDKAEEKPPVVA